MCSMLALLFAIRRKFEISRRMSKMRRGAFMKIKWLLLVSISGFLIALDQLTKLYIHANFFVGQTVPVIPDIFHITYVRNPGAAFGFLAQSNPAFREAFFLLVPLIAVVIILNILRKVDETDKLQIIALSMIFGGAIGNYVDRIRLRYVIDFLDFHYKNVWTYPAFNVADSAIVTGVGILVLIMLRERKQQKT